MNAIELFHQDGKAAGVFYCSSCRNVAKSKELADKCCEPTKCQYCGKESGRQHYLAFVSCEQTNDAKREAERFAKATKTTDWSGWVYLDGTGNDGFSESVDHFAEYWEDCREENEEFPAYVWACKSVPFAHIDVDRILDRIAEDSYEGFSVTDLNGVEQLKAAIEVFNDANKNIVSYDPDYSLAVLLESQGNP